MLSKKTGAACNSTFLYAPLLFEFFKKSICDELNIEPGVVVRPELMQVE
jgi:hypothetical protein